MKAAHVVEGESSAHRHLLRECLLLLYWGLGPPPHRPVQAYFPASTPSTGPERSEDFTDLGGSCCLPWNSRQNSSLVTKQQRRQISTPAFPKHLYCTKNSIYKQTHLGGSPTVNFEHKGMKQCRGI